MTDAPAPVKMRAAEFLRLPESNLPCELIGGEVDARPAQALEHQRAVLRSVKFIDGVILNGEVLFAPLDIIFDDDHVFQPDVFWIAEGSACVRAGHGFQGAPDLVVEVLSPGTAKKDKQDKFAVYQKYGVREYWLVAPHERFIEVWARQGEALALVDVVDAGRPLHSPLLGTLDTGSMWA